MAGAVTKRGPISLVAGSSRVPAIINRNSASAAKDNVFVYWVSPAGEIQPAPDSRITETQMRSMWEYRDWHRFEAIGAKEIEKISLIISRQMFEKQKKMKVQQALRELEFLKQAEIGAKLRQAQGYSKNDVAMNEKQENRWARRQELALAAICSEFQPDKRNTALEIEVRERSTSKLAHVNQKREGICG